MTVRTRSGTRPSKEYMRNYYQDNKERLNKQSAIRYMERPEITKASSLIKLGWTLETYNRAYKEQQGLCAICEEPERIIRNGRPWSLSADHAHEAVPRPRGLLCSRCNHGIGNFKDNVALLKRAITYLEKHAKEETNVRALFAVV